MKNLAGSAEVCKPYSPPFELPPILHPDLIEAYIELDKQNVEILSGDFDRFVYDLICVCGGPRNAKPAFYAGKHVWSLTLHHDIASVHIQLPLLDQSFSPAIRGRGIPYHTRWLARRAHVLCDEIHSGRPFTRAEKRVFSDGIPRKKFINKPFPTWSDLLRHGYKHPYLGKITISDRGKNLPIDYLEEVEELLEVIEEKWGIHLVPKRLEMAIDTLDESKGKALRMQSTLKWADPSRMLFHVIKDPDHPRKKFKILGPTPDGNGEYLNYRPKQYSDERPNDERPRGGRRQLRPYTKETPWEEYPIYRTEVIFYTTYLRKWIERKGISTVRELIQRSPDIVRENLALRCLVLNKLYGRHPMTKRLQLENLSFRGQCYKLARAGYSNEVIKPFVRELPHPNYFAVTDVKQVDRWYADRTRMHDEHEEDWGWLSWFLDNQLPGDALLPAPRPNLLGSINNIGLQPARWAFYYAWYLVEFPDNIGTGLSALLIILRHLSCLARASNIRGGLAKGLVVYRKSA